MHYSEGQIGRVFVVRVDDGEDMLLSLGRFILEKNIQVGSIHFLGALRDGRMVTGPEEPVIPPVPHFVMFEGGWEIVGIGTISPGEDGPRIHYHASVGRSGHALTGCLREKALTYIVLEAVIMEFIGLSARREFDEQTQVLLSVPGQKAPPVEKQPDGDAPAAEDNTTASAGADEESDELGSLADIIRDLTRRPSG